MAAETERRVSERRARLGGQVRTLRSRRRWSQERLGERAGVGRLVISRIERGIGAFDLETLERLGLALGVPLAIEFGRDPREQVADAGHLAMQELVLRTGRHAGYHGQFELPTRPSEPWRSIDVGLFNVRRRVAICAECWNVIGDIGAASRTSARKQAELEDMWTARWGDEGRVGLVWVVRATRRNRALVEQYPEVFRRRFPGSSRSWVRALTEGAEVPDEPGLVWCDVHATRLFHWRRTPESNR
jgi:transcriptional regulator with XRE-family HTH domain